jgi:hypothetical protein
VTIDEYYAAVRRLGLRPSSVPHVYLTSSMDAHNVPDATEQTPEQRVETIEKLKGRLGVAPSRKFH